MNLESYYKGNAIYSYSEEKKFFEHNLNEDYHLFIIWQNGRYFEKKIMDAIGVDFEIISSIKVKWSDDKIIQNFNRFYKAVDDKHISNKAETMGNGEFLCLIIKDHNPAYHYRKTVSGSVELVNSKVVKVKRETRDVCGGYYVHSSATPEEFYEQAVLLLGEKLLQEVLNCQHESLSLAQDLKGAGGWASFSDLFATLQYSSKYLVLRNFEFLPFDFFDNDKDVDILCENVIDFISASNANIIELTDGGAKLIINIAGRDVPFDIRFIGDNYYHANWSRDMLEQRVRNINNVYRPRIDDYFFSLLYHSTLQKPQIKPDYIDRFGKISKELQLDFFDIEKINDNEYVASILQGYFEFKKYSYIKPKDQGVYINYAVLKYISKQSGGDNSMILFNVVKSFTPRKIIDIIPLVVKLKLRRLLG